MRRTTAFLAVLLLGAAPATAQAATTDGSGFLSLTLNAVGSGQSFRFTASDQVPAEIWVPYAAADLHLGAGTATSSVAWPGEVGASIGSAAVILGAPPEAQLLNDPFVARARTGSGAPAAHNASLPGSTMDAHAQPDDIHAETVTSVVDTVASAAGSTQATARVRLTGPTSAAGEATSVVRDVTVGVVRVQAVTGTATGTTDGVHADATGSTVVTGLTVAGTPVTLDQSGLHVAGTGVPYEQATDAVTAALAQAQLKLSLAQPSKQVAGGSVRFSSGGLQIATPLGVLTFGATSLDLSGARTDPVPTSPLGQPPVPPTGSAPLSAVGTPGDLGGAPLPQAGSTSDLPPVIRSVLHVLRPVSLPTGYAWWVLPLGVLLALLTSAAMRRLPAAVLPGAAATCPTEEEP